jgi:hypothetical protein
MKFSIHVRKKLPGTSIAVTAAAIKIRGQSRLTRNSSTTAFWIESKRTAVVVAQFSPRRTIAGRFPSDARYFDDRVRIHPATMTMTDTRPKSIGVAVSQNTIKRSQT